MIEFKYLPHLGRNIIDLIWDATLSTSFGTQHFPAATTETIKHYTNHRFSPFGESLLTFLKECDGLLK